MVDIPTLCREGKSNGGSCIEAKMTAMSGICGVGGTKHK